jgi:DNA-directed RNA polymerase specialized sigma24 family protein
MLKATHSKAANEFEYATAGDFSRIFGQDMNSLFLLAVLLTGDHEKAEQCFVAALENATNRRTVFKDWARSWARRAIIQAALDMIDPRPRDIDQLPTSQLVATGEQGSGERIEIAAVRGLQPFDRFVFVMSVLEGYSHHTCAILLGCRCREVIEGRSRALAQLGREVESRFMRDRLGVEAAALPDEKPALGFPMFATSA